MGLRGATGAASVPKPDKTPITAACRRCRCRVLFFKIKVRPRSCRSYTLWRPWPPVVLESRGIAGFANLMVSSSCENEISLAQKMFKLIWVRRAVMLCTFVVNPQPVAFANVVD